MTLKRNYPSGFAKRKKKQRVEKLVECQRGAIDKFFTSDKQIEQLVEDLNSEEFETLVNNENENLVDNENENLVDESLKAGCVNLEEFLKHGEISDIDGRDLLMELKVLKERLPKKVNKPIEVLNHLQLMAKLFPKFMGCLQDTFDYSDYSCIGGKKLFKVTNHQKLPSINHVTRKIEWISIVIH
ncbi:hypothetical protein ACSBR2_028222 [Camellia fascicularis]